MVRSRKRTGVPRSGVAATELAILLPFIGFLFLITLDYSRVFQLSQVLDSSAHAAAFYASGHAQKKSSYPVPPITSGPGPEAETWARDAAVAEGSKLSPPLTSKNVAVSYQSGAAVVTVTYDFNTNYLGVPTILKLTRTVHMPVAP